MILARSELHAQAKRCIALARETGKRKWLRAARCWLLAAQCARLQEGL